MNIFKKAIANRLAEISKKDENIFLNLVQSPPKKEYGDYSVPCFTLGATFGKNPVSIAEDLAKNFGEHVYFESVSNLGPYVNFKVNKEHFISEALSIILKEKKGYGASDIGKGKTVVIDYSSPNIAKPFSIGHFRATNIGNSLYRIFNYLGYKTIGVNHLGDWGTQFGKLIVAYKKWGNEDTLKENSIKNLLNLYVKFHELAKSEPILEDEARSEFKKLEDGNKETLKLWEAFVDASLKEFKRLYKILDVKFDSFAPESFYNDKMEEALKEIETKNLSVISEDALIIDLEKFKMPPVLLKKKDGTTLYATRDITAALYRWNKYKFSKCLYVVGSEQQLHFKQFFKVIELMGYSWAKDLHHIEFGLIQFEEGKMSTREGRVVFLEDVLSKATELAKSIIEEKNPKLENKEEVANDVAIGALKFFDLSAKRVKSVQFKWNEILNFDGETGPYLQYTYARINSVVEKSELKLNKTPDFNVLADEAEFDLIKCLVEFPDAVISASNEYEPSIISSYLINLAKEYNRFYNKCRILEVEEHLKEARVFLSYLSALVLENGLKLLGIKTPKKM